MPTNKSGTKTTAKRTTGEARRAEDHREEVDGEEDDGEEDDREEGHGEEGHSEEGHREEGHGEEGHSEEGHGEEGHGEEGHSRWPRASACRPIGPNCDWSCRDTGRADINGVDGSPAGRPHRHRLRSGRLTASRGRGSQGHPRRSEHQLQDQVDRWCGDPHLARCWHRAHRSHVGSRTPTPLAPCAANAKGV